ncbi:MAG: secretion system protein Por, partial [Chitinophagaceae bacterium]
YITKSDKTTGNDPVAWTMSSYATWQTVNFIHDLPKPENVTAVQNTYIKGQFMNLKTATANDNTSLVNGYPSIIDVPSFIDFMIMNEFASNVDGYQNSTYFHKDRNGKLRAGPIWDFNLTYGNDLFIYGFDRSHTDLWQFDNDDNDGAKFWKDLFDEPTYKCYLSKRWAEMTAAGKPLNFSYISTFIDNTVSYISAAAVRENEKWGTVPNQAADIADMKAWIAQRISWINSQLPAYTACNNVAIPALVITRINYNPSTNSTFTVSNDQEFIEIKNAGTTTVNLTGIYFRGTGLVYQFPANQTLAAGASVMLASNTAVFQSKYGFAASGQFTRNLSNSNQDLVLADGFGNMIDHVHYYDSAPWPNADGNGYFCKGAATGSYYDSYPFVFI